MVVDDGVDSDEEDTSGLGEADVITGVAAAETEDMEEVQQAMKTTSISM